MLGPVDIRETITDAVAACPGPARRIEAAPLDVPATGIGTMVADAKRVRQVLFNLLSNAIGFSRRARPSR